MEAGSCGCDRPLADGQGCDDHRPSSISLSTID